jgi:hypothetical protein
MELEIKIKVFIPKTLFHKYIPTNFTALFYSCKLRRDIPCIDV